LTDGILLIDKPAGITSHDVVARVRRTHGGRSGPKVGHAGTLDPFATGLLIVLLGRATRAQRFFMDQPKRYETTAQFGATSTTGDPEGEITQTGRIPPEPLELPTGEVTQTPPAFSAIKIDGERAYKAARRGEDVEIPERTVQVQRFDQTARDDASHTASFLIECSSGTYVRSLIADLGDAYCLTLRRTAIGPFEVADADDEHVIGLGDALARVMPVLDLEPDRARMAIHGRAVSAAEAPAAAAILLRDAEGPIAIAHRREDGEVKPVVGFRGS
jgi:tRNA pseudouridine55 synthase